MASHLSTSPSLQEHHRGSLSSRRSPRFYDTSDDEFYDAFEAGMFIMSLIIELNDAYFPSNPSVCMVR
jgi:hypothetical protein